LRAPNLATTRAALVSQVGALVINQQGRSSKRRRFAVALSALSLCASACEGVVGSDTTEISGDGNTAHRGGALDASAAKKDGGAKGAGDAGRRADESSIIYIDGKDGGTFVRTDNCPVDAPLAVDRVRIYTVDGGGAKVEGASFQGSNEATTSGFVELAKIVTAPKDDGWTEYKFANDTVYRYLRFFDAEGRDARIAEIEFYHGPIKLTGRAYGTAPAGATDSPFANAFDGNTDTYFSGTTSGGNYLGYDIAGSYVAASPSFTPTPGALSKASDVTISSTTPAATIRYTTDGSTPTATSGVEYSMPIHIASGRLSIRALASAPCYFASDVATASYGVGAAAIAVGQKSYHIGNSLTDQLNDWLEPIADSAGVDHTYARSTIPGSTVGYLWDHRNECTGTPEQASSFDSFVSSYAPIDHMSLQPFADPTLAVQGEAGVRFFAAAQAHSPDVQPWIYAQWADTQPNGSADGTRGYLQDELARGADWASWPAPSTPVPNTWEDTTDAQLRYHEAFADFVDQRLPGRNVLVCPCGSALAELKRRVDKGRFPGISDFFGAMFEDDLHLNPIGHYLVSLVFYACIYRQTPEGHVTAKPNELTQQQATMFQQIAWQVASGYERSGISPQ
jgi:hypothetical protein